MNIELESMAIEMPRVAGHPNREPFRGVLTLVDVVSDKPPAGARGHRVVLDAQRRQRQRCRHCWAWDWTTRHRSTATMRGARVGVITRAEIVGRQLELGGYLFAKDFPEIVREIGRGGGTAGSNSAGSAPRTSLQAAGPVRHAHSPLGMSYEIADARVADVRSRVWTLTHVTFTGAAILRRDKAAYRNTWIELG